VTAKPIVPREQANRDVDAAVDYYLKEAGGRIALDFIDALERAYRHISRHPASGSTRYSVELSLAGLRAWPVRRFPHIVFYVEGPDEVDVWRVLQGTRDIPEWMRETVRKASSSRSAGKGG
jgi:toxin ParE1/3/4